MNDFSQYLAILLPAGGAALQWMRAHANQPEWKTFAFALGIALGVYALCLDWAHLPRGVTAVQQAVLDGLAWLVSVGLPAVLGGTFIASKAANAGVPGVPQTNSK